MTPVGSSFAVASSQECARVSVAQLSLCAFRNYEDVRLDPCGAPVVLTGENGSGKTNLLEAISLLVPGRGLRRAALPSLQRLHTADSWGVAAKMEGALGDVRVGTGRDPESLGEGSERRLLVIDGKVAKNQQALAQHVAMAWITPDMDRLLCEGASARRRWIDRLAYSFDPAHAGRVQRYEKAMRERSALLREGGDGAWLAALEDSMAQSGVAIAAARRDMVSCLAQAMDETLGLFPQADLHLAGRAEEALDDKPALLIEDELRAAWVRMRGEDAASGTCSVGPHRTDLRVVHRAKACPADLCSTGEQKALIIAIMLAYVRSLIAARNVVPLLLLDDIAAHLDAERREALFGEVADLHVQVWATGTDPFQFGSFLKQAQHYCVAQGRIEA